MSTHTQVSKPWYKEPWPWLLAIMPLTAVIAGGFTVWFAVTSSDGLVVDDYYKQGKAINQTKERDRQAQLLGIRAQLLPQGSDVNELAQRLSATLEILGERELLLPMARAARALARPDAAERVATIVLEQSNKEHP